MITLLHLLHVYLSIFWKPSNTAIHMQDGYVLWNFTMLSLFVYMYLLASTSIQPSYVTELQIVELDRVQSFCGVKEHGQVCIKNQ